MDTYPAVGFSLVLGGGVILAESLGKMNREREMEMEREREMERDNWRGPGGGDMKECSDREIIKLKTLSRAEVRCTKPALQTYAETSL